MLKSQIHFCQVKKYTGAYCLQFVSFTFTFMIFINSFLNKNPVAKLIFDRIPCSNFLSELHVYERWCQERTAAAWQERTHVESAAQVSDRTFLFIIIWS